MHHSQDPALLWCDWRGGDEDGGQGGILIQASKVLGKSDYLSLVLDQDGFVWGGIETRPDLCVDHCPSALRQLGHVYLEGPDTAHVCEPRVVAKAGDHGYTRQRLASHRPGSPQLPR